MQHLQRVFTDGQRVGEARTAFLDGAFEQLLKDRPGALVLVHDHAQETVTHLWIGNKVGVGPHQAFVGAHQRAFDIGQHIAKERRARQMLGQDGIACGVLVLQPLQGGAGTEPAGQIEARLRPGEHPGNRAQVIQCGLTGAPCRTRTDAGVFQRVDGSGVAEEDHEVRCQQESAVGIAAPVGQAIHHRRGGIVLWRAEPMPGAGPGSRSHQQLDIVNRRAQVRILLRNGFPLLRHPHETMERTMRQRFHEPMRGPRAATHRAAAPMEEDRPGTVLEDHR